MLEIRSLSLEVFYLVPIVRIVRLKIDLCYATLILAMYQSSELISVYQVHISFLLTRIMHNQENLVAN